MSLPNLANTLAQAAREIAAKDKRIAELEAIHEDCLHICDLKIARINELEKQLTEAQANAERYRRLRQIDLCFSWEMLLGVPITRTEDIDAAVDAMREGE